MQLELMTPEEIYLEWVNNWLNVRTMAEYYQVGIPWLNGKIDEGRTINWTPKEHKL